MGTRFAGACSSADGSDQCLVSHRVRRRRRWAVGRASSGRGWVVMVVMMAMLSDEEDEAPFCQTRRRRRLQAHHVYIFPTYLRSRYWWPSLLAHLLFSGPSCCCRDYFLQCCTSPPQKRALVSPSLFPKVGTDTCVSFAGAFWHSYPGTRYSSRDRSAARESGQ